MSSSPAHPRDLLASAATPRLFTVPVHGGPAPNPFTPALHVPQFSPGNFVVNDYGLSILQGKMPWAVDSPGKPRYSTDPFVRFRQAYGQAFLSRLWEHGLRPPADPNHIAFVPFLESGLCSGIAATVGYWYERYRLHATYEQLGHVSVPAFLDQALFAQLQVLTADVLLHLKWFLYRDVSESYRWIAQYADTSRYMQNVLVLAPRLSTAFDAAFRHRLEHAHTVFLHQTQVSAGAIEGLAWDPNLPASPGKPFRMLANGSFTFQTHFAFPCTLTSDDVPDEWQPYNGQPQPTRLGRMQAIPVTPSLFFPAEKRSMINPLELIFG
jgi:hypothetical protein